MVAIAAVNFLAASLVLLLAFVAWRRPHVRGARELGALMLAVGWWTAFEGVLNLSSGLGPKLLWTQVEYLGMALAPPLFLRFARAYSGREDRIGQAVLSVVWPVSLSSVAAAWTNSLHHLFWASAVLDPMGGLLVLARGPWFWVFVGGCYAALLAGTASVAGLMLRAAGRLRMQAGFVLAASLVPWAGNLLYVSNALAIPGLDWTPIAFSFTGIALATATLRLGFLWLVPIARGAVVDTMSDGALVLDNDGRLVDHNRAAARLAGIRTRDGRNAFPVLSEPLSRALAAAEVDAQGEIELEVEGRSRTVELRTSPLVTSSGRPLGRLVLLRDITERRAAERERERLLAELKSAAAEISTLQGLLPICSSCKRIRDDQGYWNQIETYIGRHADVRFSHGLCPDCAKRLYPEVFDKTPPGGT